MFCSKCGKEIPEGAAFCPGCGTSTNSQPVSAAPAAAAPVPAQPSVVSEVFASFLAVVKGIFSKDLVKTVGNQAKNTNYTWIIGIALAVLSFTFAMPVNILQGISALIKSIAGEIGGSVLKYLEYPFFAFLGTSLLVSILTLGAMIGGLWLVAKLVSKKNVSWFCVLNLAATATLPLSACYILNMLLGLIWMPLTIILSITALFMTVILLYVGVQKLEKPEVSPFFAFTGLVAVLVIVAVAASFLLYKGVIVNWLGDAASSMGSLF